MPSPGKVEMYLPPGGFGIRVDSAVYPGYSIPPFYDSMVAKLIVHGKHVKRQLQNEARLVNLSLKAYIQQSRSICNC